MEHPVGIRYNMYLSVLSVNYNKTSSIDILATYIAFNLKQTQMCLHVNYRYFIFNFRPHFICDYN